MGRLKQRAMWIPRPDRPSQRGLVGLLGISFLLLFSGCAQLDQLLGRQPDAGKSAPPIQATEPVSKPVAKKKADESRSSSIVTEPRQQAPVHAPASGVAKQSEQEKALTDDKEQSLKEKKSRVASDRKLKKSPKPQAEPQPPTEDAFLPPVPLPSKPAAIGGSGG